MKRMTIFLLVIFTALFQFTTASEGKESSHLKVWQLYAKEHQQYMPQLFKAIEIKHDVRFKDDLNEFIKSAPPTARFSALAIYTYATLGGADAAQKFDRLLRGKIDPKENISRAQMDEKGFALEYMFKLGMRPSDEAVKQLKSDMVSVPDPYIVTKTALGLKKFGIELSEDEKASLKKFFTKNWLGIDVGKSKELGIQLDWEKLFKQFPPDKTNNRERLLQSLLFGGDEDSKKLYLKSCGNLSKPTGKFHGLNMLIGASIGDKTAIEYLKKSMTSDQAKLCEKFPGYFPDEVLFTAEKIFQKGENCITTARFLREYKKRNLNSVVDSRVRSIKDIMQKSLKKKKADYHIYDDELIIEAIAGYDPKLFLNWMSDMLDKFPREDTLAIQLCLKATSYRPYEREMNPEVEKWLKENPEKLARAMDIWVKTSPYTFSEKIAMAVGLLPEDPYIHALPMLFLPDEIFNKYFSKIDERHLLREPAILVKDYFNADWKIDPTDRHQYNEYED